MIDKDFKTGELVEVALTDNIWVAAEITSEMETRLGVRLLQPVVMVEKTITVTGYWFWRKTTISETSKYVEMMSLGKGFVRDSTA